MQASKKQKISMPKFPLFSLSRLLKTVFNPKKGEKLCILIDLEDPNEIKDFAFLKNKNYPVQKRAHDVIYQGLKKGIAKELELGDIDIYAYKMTGASNLELPEICVSPEGDVYRLDPDIYSAYNIILCVGNYSATAPVTQKAKKYGFRGATMHGMNDIILQSGLAVDYNEVSRQAEILRKAMTYADYVDVDFTVQNKEYHLHIDLGRQEAQKSHGICREKGEIANLPAGEVYFVPVDARGTFPIKFEEDGTLAAMKVENNKVVNVSLIQGDQNTVNKYQNKFQQDPATSILGELGFGTQVLPYSKADIQDEKIFGTFHVATGRNDHLNGDVTFEKFLNPQNASHEDILFSSTKTPEIEVKEVRMSRDDKVVSLIKNYMPSAYLTDLYNLDKG